MAKPSDHVTMLPLPNAARWVAAALGVLLAGLLVTSSRLTPDARGFGTHEQLGMSGCWVKEQTGHPCPSCGMTTAWAHTFQGDLLAAAKANAGGLLLCLSALVAAPWLLLSALRGRWLTPTPQPTTLVWFGTILLIIVMLDWARRVIVG